MLGFSDQLLPKLEKLLGQYLEGRKGQLKFSSFLLYLEVECREYGVG